jgi:penicillin amidase
MKLQQDNYNLKAAESLPYFLSNIDSTKLTGDEKTAWQALKSWDYYNNEESKAAAYYEAWWDELLPMTWDEFDEQNNVIDFPTTYTTIKLLKEQPTLPWFDIKSTTEKETAPDLLQKSFKLGLEDIAKWTTETKKDLTWGNYKGTIIRHLMQLDPLSVKVQYGGNHDIVNATSRTHGPSWRMIVSLEKSGIKAWGVYPGGQSGNAGSAYYANMIPMWATGKYIPLQFTGQDDLASSAIGKTTFKPASK